MLTKETKEKIIKEYGVSENDTGSAQVQIALLTADINALNAHFKVHKHDYHGYRGLMKKIGHRRNLLRYLRENDLEAYRTLIKKLGLRG